MNGLSVHHTVTSDYSICVRQQQLGPYKNQKYIHKNEMVDFLHLFNKGQTGIQRAHGLIILLVKWSISYQVQVFQMTTVKNPTQCHTVRPPTDFSLFLLTYLVSV